MEGICNNNPKNMPSDEVYTAFNNFIFSNDIKLIGKLLHRFSFFEKTKDLPGDIVECGVFRGSGVATFLKFIDIYCHHSNKKIIGFDLFNTNSTEIDTYKNGDTMKIVYSKVPSELLNIDEIEKNIRNIEIDKSKYLLVKGDVCVTTKEFVNSNPGFRISLLYMDLDLDEPTYYSLLHLWDRILPGGIIVFDEYEYHKFDESNGVDKFLKEKKLEYNIVSTNFMAPTAYIIKK